MSKKAISQKTIMSLFAASAASVVLFACGGGSPSTADLSDNAKQGLQIAQSNGCASCHGADFGGASGPSWQGLAGSVRNLTDGSEVVANRAYLVEAIMDPSAKVVRGYSLMMPSNGLSADEVELIVDYIEEIK